MGGKGYKKGVGAEGEWKCRGRKRRLKGRGRDDD